MNGNTTLPDSVRIENGNLYLDASLYEHHFPDTQNVVLLANERGLLLVPVRHAAAGGLLVKIRNARRDRVVHVREVLVGRGISEDLRGTFPAQWDSEAAGLHIRLSAT